MTTKSVNIHATCVRLGKAGTAFGALRDAGILLLGDSGVGKSDLALRLIAQGATLVSDDRTELFVARGRLCARAPRTIAGLIEVRGLGIVKVAAASSATIALAVTLSGKIARLPARKHYKPPPGLPACAALALIKLNPFEASAPAKIALAAAAFAQDLFRENVNTT